VPLRLGTVPDHLDVVLVPDADFVESVETLTADMITPQPWPTGTTLTLVFGDAVSWPATIDTNIVSWNVQSDAVNEVIESQHRGVKLWYENGTVKVPLAIGQVSVHG
jgi:hypothetical protein